MEGIVTLTLAPHKEVTYTRGDQIAFTAATLTETAKAGANFVKILLPGKVRWM